MEKQHTFTIRKIIPNMITISAICCGMTSIRFSIAGDFIKSAVLIMIACILDAFDGNIARRLNASSPLGAQMDSMGDLIDFGVAPSFFIYYWKINDCYCFGKLGWIACLLLTICMVLRLARFNVGLTIDDPNSPLVKYFFVGCPAPMDALLILLPFAISKEFNVSISPLFATVYTMIIAFFTCSTIPTFTPKRMKISDKYKIFVLLIFTVLVAGAFFRTWITLTFFLVMYIISIIYGWFLYAKFKKELNNGK